MRLSLLSWVCSVLTLHSGSSSAVPPSIAELPNEMLDAIVRQAIVSQKFDFCAYVDWLAVNRLAWFCTDVGTSMVAEAAKEEASLGFDDDKQRFRKQRILKNVRTFVRIHSSLPIDCKEVDADKLRELAVRLESIYEDCASYSESPTWKKACMAGLFGRNTLNTLLRYLSVEFRQNTKEILLQTAFFVGDIDSLKAITKFFGILKEDVPNMVSELDIVFSGSVDFFDELFKLLPNVLPTKPLGLIREACSLNRLDILLRILKVANPVESHEQGHIIGSFCRLKLFKSAPQITGHLMFELGYLMVIAAWRGHLPIIRFLWSAMGKTQSKADAIVKDMMIQACWKSHFSVLKFLLWESGVYYMELAQLYVNDAFEAAIGGGNVELMNVLRGDDDAGDPVAPGLGLTTLNTNTLYQAIMITKNWDGIKYLVRLKEEGDRRFKDFELVDQDNTALCEACRAGNYKLVKYLLRRTDDGNFVFPRTNPAAQKNKPLIDACGSVNLRIVEMLLTRDLSGSYIYKGIDPSAQKYQSITMACYRGRLKILKFLLKMEDGKYVLPGMEGVNLGPALDKVINQENIKAISFLLKREDGRYVLPGMEGVDLACALRFGIERNRIKAVRFLLKKEDGRYVFPGMKGVDLTLDLWEAINRCQIEVVKLLLEMENEKYVLPEMNYVDLSQALWDAIHQDNIDVVRFLLKMENGKYVLPEMNGVDLILPLCGAIDWDRMNIVRFLLSRNLDGSYLFPGVELTEEMFTMVGQSHQMRELLEWYRDEQLSSAA